MLRRSSLRDFVVPVAIVLVGTVMAACSGGDSAVGPPDRNATLRMAAGVDPWPDEGTGPRSNTFTYPLNMNVYETLVALAPDFTVRPNLAERWELIDGNRTWRFYLRQNVKFHDGRPFTADDVLWTWSRLVEANKLITVLASATAESIRRVDDFTVDITPTTPNLRLPEQLVHSQAAILPQGNNFDSKPPVGTGPYRVVDYNTNVSANFERFDGYWGPKPAVRRLELAFMADPAARVKALELGQADLVLDVPLDAEARLAKNPRMRVVRSQPGRTQVIYVNKLGNAPFELGADPVIRNAVSMAVDRRAYVSRVFVGKAEPARSMVPAAVLGPAGGALDPLVTNPDRARQVLDEAGWVPGADGIRSKGERRLSLTITGWAEVPPSAFGVLTEQLAQVGIELKANAAPDQPTFRAFYRDTEFDLDLEVPSQNDADPAFLPVLRMYSKNAGTARFAPGGRFDEIAGGVAGEANRAEVQRRSVELMNILTTGEHIVIPLAGVPRVYAMARSVNLARPHPAQSSQNWTGLTKAAR